MKSAIQSGNPHVRLVGKVCAFVAAMVAAGLAQATPTVTIDSVAQRWPWNNKVDITYTIADGIDMAKAATGEDSYYKIEFDAIIGGTTYVIDGSKAVLAPVTTGRHTVTWTNAPSGIFDSNCSMGATIKTTDAYYMIIDIATGKWVVDDIEDGDSPAPASYTDIPTASCARYNTDLHKTGRIVLRRIPRTAAADAAYASGYPTGDNALTANTNTKTNWVTTTDYFIGIFATTVAQYMRVMSPGSNEVTMRPKSSLPYATLRNSQLPGTDLGSDSSSGSFFERLNALTGLSGFDLPTAVMSEIGHRAGCGDYRFFIGKDSVTQSDANTYFWEKNNIGGNVTKGVGLKKANRWGLYDVMGNIYELCRDGNANADVADAPDPWTPADEKDNGKYLYRNGGSVETAYGSLGQYASRCQYGDNSATIGFRIAFRAK